MSEQEMYSIMVQVSTEIRNEIKNILDKISGIEKAIHESETRCMINQHECKKANSEIFVTRIGLEDNVIRIMGQYKEIDDSVNLPASPLVVETPFKVKKPKPSELVVVPDVASKSALIS